MTKSSQASIADLRGANKKAALEAALRLVPLDGAAGGESGAAIPAAPRAQIRSQKRGSKRGRVLLYSCAGFVILFTGFVAWSIAHENTSGMTSVVSQASASPAKPMPVANNKSFLTASGYVVARRQATLSAQVTGRVDAILVSEGQQIKMGDLVAQLDGSAMKSSVLAASARYEKTLSQVEVVNAELLNARMSLERYEGLALEGFATRKDLDASRAEVSVLEAQKRQAQAEVAAFKADLATARIGSKSFSVYAPFNGTVIAINAYEGEIVSPVSMSRGYGREGICTIVDMDSLELEVDVSETHLARVSPGNPVKISLTAYPNFEYNGEVVAVVPIADRSKATFKVRVKILDWDERMLPEMVANVKFLQKQV